MNSINPIIKLRSAEIKALVGVNMISGISGKSDGLSAVYVNIKLTILKHRIIMPKALASMLKKNFGPESNSALNSLTSIDLPILKRPIIARIVASSEKSPNEKTQSVKIFRL